MRIYLATTPTKDLAETMKEMKEVKELQNTTIQSGNKQKKVAKLSIKAIHGGGASTTIMSRASMSGISQRTTQSGWRIRRRTKSTPTANDSLGDQLERTRSLG